MSENTCTTPCAMPADRPWEPAIDKPEPDSAVRRIAKTFGDRLMDLSGIALFALMILTVLDVTLRSVFNLPVKGSMELVEIFMIMAVFPAFIWIQNNEVHLNVDLLTGMLPLAWQRVLAVFCQTVSVVFISILAYELFNQTMIKMQEADATLLLKIPLWPFVGLAALCLLLLAFYTLLDLLKSIDCCRTMGKTWAIAPALLLAVAVCAIPFIMAGTRMGFSRGAFGGIIMGYMFILILGGMPIGVAMLVSGLQGLIMFMPSLDIALGMAGGSPYYSVASLAFSVIPMFVLMGELALFGEVSTDLFRAASTCLGRLPGGLAISSVCGCAGFAAVCGDSMATAMTMASVGLPAMKEKNYDPAFGAACLSIGGTLGILIPPSMGFIVYSIVTEESVGRLFMAGIVPGILLTAIICATIIIVATLNPTVAPRGDATTTREKLRSLAGMLPMLGLFSVIMGGILTGLCTPTEGGAVGSFACLLYCVARGRLNFHTLRHALRQTSILTSKIFLILIGVGIMGYFLASTRLPFILTDLIVESGLGKYTILLMIVVLYLILGCLMNVIPMVMLVLPALFPTVVALGFDPIWFGVITVLLMELGQITPPIGVLVFAMSSVVPEVPMMRIFKYVVPFFFSIFFCVLLLTIFPQICLFLPDLLLK